MRRVLLVNPPIHDFSAHDFWLKPFGLLRVAGQLRGQADFTLYDHLDRLDPRHPQVKAVNRDNFGRGHFHSEHLTSPPQFSWAERRYKRYGSPRRTFQEFLAESADFEVALVQTTMTYWYPGVREVIADLRQFSPQTRIVLGGVYATLCPAHARSLGADLVVEGLDLSALWSWLELTPDAEEPPLWEAYRRLEVGVLKLADGCPFRCTYCSVPQVYPRFEAQRLQQSLRELELLVQLGVKDVAFYDDALLHQPDQILLPFLQAARERGLRCRFHTPNALNARFITAAVARAMIEGGFKTFHLGFESSAYQWQRKTGGKVYSHELARAVDNLVNAGADREHLTAYLILGHPDGDLQAVEDSIHFAADLGLRVMLSEFSPIPGTPDGEQCRQWVDLDEPLYHSKTIFPLLRLGKTEVNRLKRLARTLNEERNSYSSRRRPDKTDIPVSSWALRRR